MYDITIIGGGVAGSSAAVMAARNRFKTLLLDKGPEFSSLGVLASVSDMPGFDGKISGTEVLNLIKKQAKDLGAEVKTSSVTSLIIGEPPMRIITNEPVTYETKTVILATGNAPQSETHAYIGERELLGRGVSHDINKDLQACKHAPVLIIGKSSHVAEEALKLAEIAEKVYWVIPASKLDIEEELKAELEAAKRIEPFFSTSLRKINGSSEVTSATILTAGQEKTLSVKHVFLPAQQCKPATEYLNGSGIQMGPGGVIMVSQQLETNASGVFAAGNILCTELQLNIVCAAQGAIAALNAGKYLK